MLSLLERYEGVMIGVHTGDSLGAPYEKWEPEAIALDLERRGGLVPFNYKDPWDKSGTSYFTAGRPTDDTELTAALAESLTTLNRSDPADQYLNFKRAVQGESFVWDGTASGFGRTTRTMLSAEKYAAARLLENRPNIASNGSLMRSAPLVLWHYHRDPLNFMDTVRASSRVTHIHPTAVECCVTYAYFLEYILSGLTLDAAWSRCKDEGSSDDAVNSLLIHDLKKPEVSNVWMNKGGPVGSALHTLHIAAWCAVTASSFRDGIEEAVRFGGDTDTTAAVAGSLLGAHFGIGAIPSEWKAVLKGYNRMCELARDLYPRP